MKIRKTKRLNQSMICQSIGHKKTKTKEKVKKVFVTLVRFLSKITEVFSFSVQTLLLDS